MSRISLSRELIAAGFHPNEVARMTRAGDLVRLRRGAYAEPTDGQLDSRATHLRLLEATMPQCRPDAVVSHTSAAVLHDLPVWRDQLVRVHITRDRRGGGRMRRWVQVHGTPLPDADVVTVGGFATTSLARTVVDLGCSLPLEQAVAAGDAALNRIDGDELAVVLERNAGRNGIGRARRSIALLDPRSESAGESFSRVVFHRAGLPAPEPQFEVHDSRGRFVARTDFGWPEFGVLGEFDGKQKYGRLFRRPDQTAEDVLIDEKRREDRLRRLGWVVLRWMWDDLVRPELLLAQLRQALAQRRPVA